MRKNRILAAVCSLVFVMSCSACSGTEEEALLIGQQGAEQSTLLTEWQEAGQGILPTGQQEAEQSTLLIGQQEAEQEALLTGQQGTEKTGGVRSSEAGQVSRTEDTSQEICVYVCGAVEAPGVVFLPEGSRAADALEAAGGFAGDAAEEAVNLAARVSDGEKLYFPTCGEAVTQWEQEEAETSGLVNINTADIAQLCTLPGIGESRAADIIAYRESHGGFEACEDIMQVTGIKESVYSKISGKITVR